MTMSARRTFSSSEAWNKGQPQVGPSVVSASVAHCPQMTCGLGCLTPAPSPPVDSVSNEQRFTVDFLRAFASPSLGNPITRRGGVTGRPEEASALCDIPYLTYKEVPKKIPNALVSTCSTLRK